MGRLLFEEPFVKNSHYMKNFRLEKAVCLSVAMFALFITIMAHQFDDAE